MCLIHSTHSLIKLKERKKTCNLTLFDQFDLIWSFAYWDISSNTLWVLTLTIKKQIQPQFQYSWKNQKTNSTPIPVFMKNDNYSSKIETSLFLRQIWNLGLFREKKTWERERELLPMEPSTMVAASEGERETWTELVSGGRRRTPAGFTKNSQEPRERAVRERTSERVMGIGPIDLENQFF